MSKIKPKRKAPAARGTETNPADANQAVDAAASLTSKRPAAPAAPARKESAMFRHLKEGINQPGIGAIDRLLDKSSGPAAKRSTQPFDQVGRQVGHNQTFGADATRSGVPRRTGG